MFAFTAIAISMFCYALENDLITQYLTFYMLLL